MGKCSAVTKSGAECKIAAPDGELFCHVHRNLRHNENPEIVEEKPTQAETETNPGMVEVSLAIAGISIAFLAFLPTAKGLPLNLSFFFSFFSSILAVFSTYAALWLLARYCSEERSQIGLKEISELIANPHAYGPYWLLAMSLVLWLVIGASMGWLAIFGQM